MSVPLSNLAWLCVGAVIVYLSIKVGYKMHRDAAGVPEQPKPVKRTSKPIMMDETDPLNEAMYGEPQTPERVQDNPDTRRGIGTVE